MHSFRRIRCIATFGALAIAPLLACDTRGSGITGVTRTPATLSALALSAGTLNPAFSPNTTTYTAGVPNATTSITVTPTVATSGSTVTVNDVTVPSGTPSGAISLAAGANNITVVVTSGDGLTSRNYIVTVTRTSF